MSRAALIRCQTEALAFVERRAARKQRMCLRRAAVVCERRKAWIIYPDLIARVREVTSCVRAD